MDGDYTISVFLKRRGSLLWLAALLLTGACADAPDPAATVADARPNIIYILADDLGYGELGSYGQSKIRTPNLDRLAAEGMRFTQHYSGSPVCAPSRATLMSGKHTGHTLIKDNFELGGWTDEEERGQMPLPPGSFTLGRMLQDVGYATAAIGKWGLGGPGTTGVPNAQGFDFFYGYLDQKQAHNYYPTHLWRNEVWDTLANPYFSPHQRFEGDDPTDPTQYEEFSGRDYAQDLMAQEALSFIRDRQDDPFFLYLPFPIPHLALQVPEESVDEYAGEFDEEPYLGDRSYLPHRRPLSAYAAMITRMDAQIGEIVALIDELGLGENTLIIFTSDNGTTYTGGVDAAFFESTAGLRGLKGSVYEGGVRVPMIARWTGRIEPGAVSDHVSAFWDMVPTFAELTGASHPADIDGISMVPTLLGRGEQRVHDDGLYWEYHGLWDGAQAVRLGDWKAVRLGGHDDPDAPIELYDLATDRGETTDVAAEHPEVVARARAVMEDRTPSEIERWNFAGFPGPETRVGRVP